MIRLKDIYLLNRKRAGKKKIGGKKKALTFNLFFSIFIPLILLNGGYGVFLKVTELLYDQDYPSQALLVVHNQKETRMLPYAYYGYSEKFIPPSSIKKLQKLEGIKAIQKEFFLTSGHYFDLDMISHMKPTGSLIGYAPDFFNLYTQIPKNNYHPGTIPILLHKDIFSLMYNPEIDHFEKKHEREIKSYVGEVFNITIDPLFGADLRFSWEKDQNILLHKDQRNNEVHRRMESKLKKMQREGLHSLRYSKPLTFRFQIVGFLRDNVFFSRPYPSPYGAIPLENARKIKNILELRKEGLHQNHGNKKKNAGFLYITVVPEKKIEVVEKIKKLGLKVEDRQTLNEERVPSVLKSFKKSFEKDKEAIFNVIGIALFFLYALIFSVYQALSGKVKDSLKEIGTLRCLGATKRDIRRIFLCLCAYDVMKLTAISLLTSNLLLLVIGYKTAFYFNVVPVELIKDVFGFLAGGLKDVSSTWLIAPVWTQLLLLLAFLIPTTILAAWMPARKASNVDPVVAMKD